jgi:hypothetical protein
MQKFSCHIETNETNQSIKCELMKIRFITRLKSRDESKKHALFVSLVAGADLIWGTPNADSTVESKSIS